MWDTRWIEIQGIGIVKYEKAAPLLIRCLGHGRHLVRANAARALGEIRYRPAIPPLIHLLRREKDDGVIEQTSCSKVVAGQGSYPMLQMPGVDNPDRIKELIKGETRLELRAVVSRTGLFQTKDEALKSIGGRHPSDLRDYAFTSLEAVRQTLLRVLHSREDAGHHRYGFA